MIAEEITPLILSTPLFPNILPMIMAALVALVSNLVPISMPLLTIRPPVSSAFESLLSPALTAQPSSSRGVPELVGGAGIPFRDGAADVLGMATLVALPRLPPAFAALGVQTLYLALYSKPTLLPPTTVPARLLNV